MPLSPEPPIGSPSLPLQPAYVKAALALIIEGGVAVQARCVVAPGTSENDITYHLVEEMARAQRRGIGTALHFDPRVNTSADPFDPLKRGEIDIKFRWEEYPNVHDRYLAVEAKRLRGVGPSLADKYVTEGVADFVSAKYSRGHDYGIMLGYVQVPPLATALSKVCEAMKQRSGAMREISGFSRNSTLCTHPNTHHSIHIQCGTDISITLVHVFLDLCAN